jgi:hypothetical protein
MLKNFFMSGCLSVGLCFAASSSQDVAFGVQQNYSATGVLELEQIIDAVISTNTQGNLNSGDELDLLVLLDFDGVLFPLGGSRPRNFDQKFVALIQQLKADGALVGGLTHRPSRFFYKDVPTFKELFDGFSMLPGVTHKFCPRSMLAQGVFFAGRAFNKGKALEKILRLFEQAGKKITSNTIIVFVDDCPANLEDVAVACSKYKFKLVNIHYVASWRSLKRLKLSRSAWWAFPMLALRRIFKFFPPWMQPALK